MKFKELHLQNWILQTLDKQHISELTKIQEQTLTYTLKQKSVIITAQTGTGKTLCYLLPILNSINFSESKTQALIVLPTKELARQVYSKVLEFKFYQPNLKPSLLIGNTDIDRQIQSIKHSHPQIIIGTVTRILDLLKRKVINTNINTLVLDEADMLIDLGFIKQVDQIFSLTYSYTLQKIACSATTHYSLANQLSKYLGNTKVISTSQSIWANELIKHKVAYSNNTQDTFNTLLSLLKNISPYFCIIFCNTKNIANDLYEKLLNRNFNVSLLHKDLSTRERKNIYKDVNSGRYQYLVATDLAARGLDIQGADTIISYDLPDEDIWYVHRIGRAGRMGNKGTSYVIYHNGMDNKIMRLQNKQVQWEYLFVNKDGTLIEKPMQLKFKSKLRLDDETNRQIKMIIGTNSKRVRPGYKKLIKRKINKIKQRKRHEYIEKRIKQTLLQKNIQDSLRKKYK